jgi:uroporphyrinogen decarboxylase
MPKLTQIDLFKATCNHKQLDKFLFYCDFTPSLYNRMMKLSGCIDMEEFEKKYYMFNKNLIFMKQPDGFIKPDFSKYFADMNIPEGSKINPMGVLEVPGSVEHFTRFVSPLRHATTLKEIENYPFQTYDGWGVDSIPAEIEACHAKGQIASGYIGHMYEDAWEIRGYEEFLMDMYAEPDICHFILDKICEKNIVAAKAFAKAGVDMLVTGDDVASQIALMFNPDIWREFIKSRWAKVYAAAREIKPDIEIWYHSDGNIEVIIPELIDIGVTILNPIQPECVDVYKLQKEYGKHLVFDGTIGTQTTMPFGSADDVRKVIKERKEIFKDGLIISPSHVLEPEVPVENIMAFLEESAK